MRASTFQRIDIPLSRDLQTDYDKIVQLTEHLDAIEVVSNMLENGVDFNELLTLTSTVEDHTTALDGKVDKVAGSSLMTDAERAKLQFIAQQATKNQADAYLVDRANHTGTQSADTVVDGVVNVAMTAAERTRLAAMDDEANNYVHPASHPVSVLDGGTNYNKVVKTDALGHVGFGDVSWTDVAGKPSTYTPSAHEHSLDEVTSGTISATRVVPTETRQFVSASQLANIADMELKTNKGIPNGYAPLNANGKINASYINDLNLMEVFTPNDLNSMLNLTSAQPGDVAYRLDTGNSYMLIALPSSLEANWKQLNAGTGVVSINGLDGRVTLGSASVPESGTNYYFTNERVDDRVVGLLQAGNNISLNYDDAANTLTVSANDISVDWSEIQNKPDPVVTVTLQGDVTGTANTTLTDLGNGTITVNTVVGDDSHLHSFANLTNKPTTLSGYGITDAINVSQKGVANGVATLDASGLVPVGQLPSYVDDVLEYTNLGMFPAVGEPGKIYVALDTNKTYRWSGTVYIYITSGAVDSVAGKTGIVSLVKADVGLSNVDNTSDLLKPISTATAAELALKAPLASPALTGTPTAPTAAVGTSTTQLATTAFVKAEIANDSTAVHKTGDETIAGVKTFSSSIVGNITGNATTATTADNANKLIGKNWYWLGKDGQPIWLWGGSDGANMYVYNPANFSVNYATTATTSNFLYGGATGATCDALFKSVAPASSGWRECDSTADAPNTGWWMIHSIRHSNGANYWGTQFAYGWENNANKMYQRNISSGTWSAWVEIAHTNGSVNYANTAGVANNSFGYGQSRQNVTASRAIGVTYTNSTGKPIFVTILGTSALGGNISLTIGGILIQQSVNGSVSNMSSIVLNGETYIVTASAGGVINSWIEIR